jgi:hypothetical protein
MPIRLLVSIIYLITLLLTLSNWPSEAGWLIVSMDNKAYQREKTLEASSGSFGVRIAIYPG